MMCISICNALPQVHNTTFSLDTIPLDNNLLWHLQQQCLVAEDRNQQIRNAPPCPHPGEVMLCSSTYLPNGTTACNSGLPVRSGCETLALVVLFNHNARQTASTAAHLNTICQMYGQQQTQPPHHHSLGATYTSTHKTKVCLLYQSYPRQGSFLSKAACLLLPPRCLCCGDRNWTLTDASSLGCSHVTV